MPERPWQWPGGKSWVWEEERMVHGRTGLGGKIGEIWRGQFMK